MRSLRDAVLAIEALVAYDIDFPEEDDGPVSRERVERAIDEAAAQIAGLLATAPAGELVRHGAVAVIAGPPNVGKSSLFNALLGRARSIVSPVPGTTRDAVDALIEPEGAPFPLRLVDTAGLRDATDAVERLGIEVSGRALGDAHVVLACGETLCGIIETLARVRTHTEAPVVGVWTKCDTAQRPDPGGLSPDIIVVTTSAETGQGLRELLSEVVAAVVARWGTPSPETPLVTRARQRHALERAADELGAFRVAWTTSALPAVVAAVHLHAAVVALEDIIGAIDIDDVLERVFGEFCVGK